MLCYVGQMGVWNEGERYEKGKVLYRRKTKQGYLDSHNKNVFEKGCKVYSDCWNAYNSLSDEGFKHYTLN